MNYIIISGSNRENSQSRKVSNYLQYSLQKQFDAQVDIIDLHEHTIPMWTEDIWNAETNQAQSWSTYADMIQKADGVIVVAPEWAGSIPPALRNILVHLTPKEVGHKPGLIVSVSAGIGGAHPISELRSFSVKNNAMVYIPDHVIVRHVNKVLNNNERDESDTDDTWIKDRLDRSVDILNKYARHLKALRNEAGFDFGKYPYGM